MTRLSRTVAGLALLVTIASRPLPDAASADRVDESCPAGHVALTFDDGPSAFRPETLAVLRAARVPATFLDVGTRVEVNPHLVRFQVREGHTVLNHTYRHDRLSELSAEDVRLEVLAAEIALQRAGVRLPFKGVRAPYGGSSDTSEQVIRDLGYVNVGAQVGGLDFVPGTPPQVIARYILSGLEAGVVILMHDGPVDTASGESVVQALPEIIAGARERGFCFGGLDARVQVVPRRLTPVREPIPALGGEAVPYKPFQAGMTLLPPPEPSELPQGLPPRYLSVALRDAETGRQVRAPFARSLGQRIDLANRAYLRAAVDDQRRELEAVRTMLQQVSATDLRPPARTTLLALTERLLASLPEA